MTVKYTYSSNIFFFVIIISLFYLLVLSKPISAVYFRDDFNSSSSLSNYYIYYNAGQVNVSNGFLELSANCGQSFPAVILDRLIPQSNYEVEVGFKYDQLARFGNGVIFSDVLPENTYFWDSKDISILLAWGDTNRLVIGYIDSPFTYQMDFEAPSDYHVLKAINSFGTYNFFLDGWPLHTITSNRNINYIWFGNSHRTTETDCWSKLTVDYIQILQNNGDENSFPYYSQLDPLWKELEYDHSSLWAPQNIGIERWGCSLTSASMVLKYYDVKSPITGEDSTPDILNDWLKSQGDGYLRNGYLNWLAITRYTRLAKEENRSATTLEFSMAAFKKEDVVNALRNDVPVILGLPGHYVVAYRNADEGFIINDPYDKENTILDHNSSITTLNTFTPSDTDLSAMLFTTPSGFKVALRDSDGIDMGDKYELGPLVDDVKGVEVLGSQLMSLITLKPKTGIYYLHVYNQNNDYNNLKLDSYLYDSNGNVYPSTINKLMSPFAEEVFFINFDKKGNNPLTIASMSGPHADQLISFISSANRFKEMRNNSKAISFLNKAVKVLISRKTSFVSEEKTYLLNYLKNKLSPLIDIGN